MNALMDSALHYLGLTEGYADLPALYSCVSGAVPSWGAVKECSYKYDAMASGEFYMLFT